MQGFEFGFLPASMSRVSCVQAQLSSPGGFCALDNNYCRCSRQEAWCPPMSDWNRSGYVCQKWQKGVFSYGVHHSGEKVDELGSISGLGCQLKRDMTFIVVPGKKKFQTLMNSSFRFGKRVRHRGPNNWRSKSYEATEERRSMDFTPVMVPSNFRCNSPRRSCSTGHTKHWVRSLHGDLAVSSSGPAVLPELEAAKVKVIGAGVGASVVLNFCQQSSLFPAAQFWYSSDSTSEPVLLSEYAGGLTSTRVEVESTKGPLDSPDSNEEMVFLVLGAGFGPSLGVVSRQLTRVRAKGSLVVGIFIQPFVFEGLKRMEQANQLIDSLLKCTDLLLVVEQDGLLSRDVVTVSDASSMAKNAVLLSIKAIVELFLGRPEESLDTTTKGSTVTSVDTKKMLQQAGKSWLGCGRGHDFKEAIEMAVADAPLSDLCPGNHLVLCTLASASGLSREEMGVSGSLVHEALGSEVQPIVRYVKNPLLETGVQLSTIIITGSCKEGTMPTVPVSSVVPGAVEVECDTFTSLENVMISKTLDLRPGNEWSSSSPQKPKQQQQQQPKSSGKNSYRTAGRDDANAVDSRHIPPPVASQSSRLTVGWEAGPSSDVAEAWAQARAQAGVPTSVASGLDLSLPIGVRMDAKQYEQSPNINVPSSSGYEVAEDKWIGKGAVPVDPDALPRNQMMDMGLEAVRDMYNAASALVTGKKEPIVDKRKASLSQRASSMLETERSQKRLTPIVEMGFKNGRYKGRCQGGLPEGKGRLSFSDGSFYDGQWKQGKRAGSGAFYYTSGDMYQGAWKDDVMHGKGWMYYHNGDRLYTNFWKGKAEGEGRFYSAQGDVFFGQFRENWRQGEFLYIEASGVRWIERWENGVLKSRTSGDS